MIIAIVMRHGRPLSRLCESCDFPKSACPARGPSMTRKICGEVRDSNPRPPHSAPHVIVDRVALNVPITETLVQRAVALVAQFESQLIPHHFAGADARQDKRRKDFGETNTQSSRMIS